MLCLEQLSSSVFLAQLEGLGAALVDLQARAAYHLLQHRTTQADNYQATNLPGMGESMSSRLTQTAKFTQ